MDQQKKPSDDQDTPKKVGRPTSASKLLASDLDKLTKAATRTETLTPRQDALVKILSGVNPVTLLTQKTKVDEEGRRVRVPEWEVNENAMQPYLVITDWILDQ